MILLRFVLPRQLAMGTHEAQKKGPPAEGRPELISAMLSPISRASVAAMTQPQMTCKHEVQCIRSQLKYQPQYL